MAQRARPCSKSPAPLSQGHGPEPHGRHSGCFVEETATVKELVKEFPIPNSQFLGGDESDLHRISSAPILLYIDISLLHTPY